MTDRTTEPPASAPDAQTASTNPVLVEGTRGGLLESAHRGAAAVADTRGRLRHAWGDVTRPVYPRSAVKPLQALPLVETGAADRFTLSDVELALACASHNGEPRQVETVKAWLERLHLTEDDLECGPHAPLNATAAEALVRDGRNPTRLHNNCSGKHAGYLTLARHLGVPPRGYSRPDHPVQRVVTRTLAEMADVDAEPVPVAVDGCGVPTLGLPLARLAAAMARLAAAHDLSPARAAAAERVFEAMGREAAMVAGRGRFCTAVIRATGGA
ncbi:MAG: asparaginase, partial [Alphaproteobacteria bacterium]